MTRDTTWCLLLLAASATACSDPDAGARPRAPSCPVFLPASTGLPDAGEWRTHPSIGDVDGDGLGDIAALARKAGGPRVFTSDGLGSWGEASEGLSYPHGFSCGVGTRLVDLDRDRDLDMVVADHCQGVLVYLGDGAGNWAESSTGIPRNLEGFNDAVAGDLDADGWPDIVALSAFTRGFLVLRGRPGGAWVPRFDTGLPLTGSGWQVELHDMNADGWLDVVTSYNPVSTDRRIPPSPPAMVWLQGPPLAFRPASGFDSSGRQFGVAVLPRADRPFPDVLAAVYGFKAGLYRYESQDGASWTEAGRVDENWFTETHKGYAGVRVADVNADGCLDIVTNESTTVAVLVAVGDCRESFELCPVDTVPRAADETAGWGLAVGDLNGDGRPDLV
jgi:hypothetical protein